MVLKENGVKQAGREDDETSSGLDNLEGQEELVEQLPFPTAPSYPTVSASQMTIKRNGDPVESTSKQEKGLSAVLPPSDLPSQSLAKLQQAKDRRVASSPLSKSTSPSSRLRTVVIPATGKKSAGTMRAPQGRRRVVHLGVCVTLVAIVFGTLAAVLPADTQGHNNGLGLFQPIMRMISSQKNDTALIAAQAATATAVTQDGYEYNGAGGNHPFAGVNTNITPAAIPAPTTAPTSSGPSAAPTAPSTFDGPFSNPFSPGQCTWWADYRYHQLTGFAIPWSGNASAWAYNAAGYGGWVVSDTPRVPSIIVLQPGVQYASGWGHVAIVERMNPDGSVYTSNYNVVGWGVLSYATYHPGPGVSFVYHV
jgi:surface antigen